MEEEKQFSVTPISSIEFAQAVFITLFGLLDKKRILTFKEIGEALIKYAGPPDVPDRDEPALDEAVLVHMRELGKALIRAR